MTSTHDTDQVIRTLAKQAGARRSAPSYDAVLIIAAALSLVSAVALVLVFFGVQQADLQATLASASFHHKVASMLTLACGGILLARFAGRPGSSVLAFASLLPGVAILLFGAATDASGLPVLGASNISVPHCVASIVLLSLPALAIVLAAIRTGVPTRPTFGGALAGMLAGVIGGAAYAIVCKNDGALFVAVWYMVAVAIVTGLGALIGRKVLAW
jgi:hypothetical protein